MQKIEVQFSANSHCPQAQVTTFRFVFGPHPYTLQLTCVTLHSMLIFLPVRIHSSLLSKTAFLGQRPHFLHCFAGSNFPFFRLSPLISSAALPLSALLPPALDCRTRLRGQLFRFSPNLLCFSFLRTIYSLRSHLPTHFIGSFMFFLSLSPQIPFKQDTTSSCLIKSFFVFNFGITPAQRGLCAGIVVTILVQVKNLHGTAKPATSSKGGVDGGGLRRLLYSHDLFCTKGFNQVFIGFPKTFVKFQNL